MRRPVFPVAVQSFEAPDALVEFELELATEPNVLSGKHAMFFGAQAQLDGSVHFRLWAPGVNALGLQIEGIQDPVVVKDTERNRAIECPLVFKRGYMLSLVDGSVLHRSAQR